MECGTCYNLDRARLSGTSTGIRRTAHDFWILLKSLEEIVEASKTGCDVCYVLSSGLLATTSSTSAELDTGKIHVDLKIPHVRHNRVRAMAYRKTASSSNDVKLLADLEFYTSHTSKAVPWAEFGRGETVASGAGADFYHSKINKWLEDCTETHLQCTAERHNLQEDSLPSRVLDLEMDKSEVHLIEPKEQKGRYIAFSYCWGSGGVPRTTSRKTPQVYAFQSLPSSFQDVICLCRRLKVRYLWIDSLCIVQEDNSDWEIESCKMLQYYSGAFLVIAASRASEPAQGFLGSHEPSTFVEPRSPNLDGVIFRRFAPHLASDQDFGLSAPLDRRAWALQERLSSRRVVHFYESEMIWECESTVQCECRKLMAPNLRLEDDSLSLKMKISNTSIIPMTKSQCFSKWTALVEHYTFCLLTREDDRLPAISGLARLFTRSGLQFYYAGLWKENLRPSLLWRVKDTSSARRPHTYLAPSWSWASLVGHVDWDFAKNYHLNFVGDILDCRVNLSGPDPFGQVTGGELRMRTRTWKTKLEYQPATGFMALACGESAYFDLNVESRTGTFYQYQSIKCVLLAEGTSSPEQGVSTLLALVVRQSSEQGETPRYTRIGLATLDLSHLKDFEEETVIVI